MALHPEFPKSPYSELFPDQRWFPAAEELRSTAYEKLMPPLVAKIRNEVTAWRDAGYSGASNTSRALLNQWFETEHMVEQADGDLSNYVPDFRVKTDDATVWIVETKGREERDLPQKMARLSQWCVDATNASHVEGGSTYEFVYVDQEGYERNPPQTFASLAAGFTEYQGG